MAAENVNVVVLGSGTSHGVPMIGCRCAVCTSDDPRDRRSRPSVFVQQGGTRFLVDTAPELRLQCLANGIDAVDAVLFTHHHADHVTGLDDLRRFNWLMKKAMPCFGSERTLAGLRQMFRYAFERAPDSPHSRPELDFHTFGDAPLAIQDAEVIPVPLMHGPMPVLGYRFGRFAYCTDCNSIPAESFDRLKGLEVLILDALRIRAHPAHFTLEQAVEAARRVGATRTYFTHMTHELKHAETEASLPDGMFLAYDGLRISI